MRRLATTSLIAFLVGCSGSSGGGGGGGDPGEPPHITTQPTDQSVVVGDTATFTVVATGTTPLSYQWKKGGVAIGSATLASYTTPPTAVADSGSLFTVTVSNAKGEVTSSAATLTVDPGNGAIALVTGMSVFLPRIAIGADASTFAIWMQGPAGGAASQIWSARRDPGTGTWSDPLRLDSGSGGSTPRVVADDNGNALAAWNEGSTVRARRWDYIAGAWQDPDDVAMASMLLALAMTPLGDAVVLVAKQPPSDATWHAHAIRRAATDTSWPDPLLIEPESDDLFDAIDGRLSVDFAGDTLASWRKQSGLSGTNLASYFDSELGTWSTTTHGAGATASDNRLVGQAIHSSGEAWLRTGSALERYDAGAQAWTPLAGFTDLGAGDLDLFDDGDVLLVNWDDQVTGSVDALRHDGDTASWGTPFAVTPNNAQNVLGRTGGTTDAVVAWTRNAPPQKFVRFRTYRSGAWSDPPDYLSRATSAGPVVDVSALEDLAMNAAGQLAAIGTEGSPPSGIWVAWKAP